MKRLALITFGSVFFFNLSCAQIREEIKRAVDSFSDKKLSNTSKLASEISSSFSSDEDKVAAIYYWVAQNITFDIKKHFDEKKKYTYNFKYKTQEEKAEKKDKVDKGIAEEVFKNKKAVAKEYSYLFKILCVKANVECDYIHGTLKNGIKDIGKKAGRIDHYWNAVKLGGEWKLIDVTWGAGELYEDTELYVEGYNETYYLLEPELFYLNHYPKDTEWLFCDKTKEDFGSLPLFHKPYIQSDLQLEPIEGMITEMPDNNKLKLVFTYRENASQHHYMLSYAYEKDLSKKALMPKCIGDKREIEVSLEGKKYDYLTIFADNRPMVSFRIKITR